MVNIIFDLDDTLYDLKQPFERAVVEYFPEINMDIDQLFYHYRRYSDLVFELTQNGKMTVSEMHVYRIRKALEQLNIVVDEDRALRFQEVYEKYQGEIFLTDEVKKVLNFCSNSDAIQMALITNGEKDRQWNKIKTLELLEWFSRENIFISGEVGYAKPNEKLFEYVENKMTLDKYETYYVGDSYDNDVVGSKNAGWNAVWFNKRKLLAPRDDNNTEKIIYDSEALLDYLKSLSSL